MLSNIRSALRSLARTPGFTVVALLTLALGIGLNTAMFSLMNVILLRPLPFAQPDSLVRLYRATPQDRNASVFSPADYLDLKRGEAAFGLFAACTNASVSLSEPGHPAEDHEAKLVSPDYFKVLEIQPELGRLFRPEEEISGNHRVVILSHALWQIRFAGAPDVLGKTIRVNGEAYEIIGVLPGWANDERVIRQAALFCPLSFNDHDRTSRERQWIDIVGRRLPAISPQQGDSVIAAFGAHLAVEFPKENADAVWRTQTLLGSTGNPTGRLIVSMLLGLSGCVLLIACSNLANFLLARTIARAHELGVRTALGASRTQLLRPLVYESLVLAALGGAGALLVSLWATDWLSAQCVAGGGAPVRFPLDWRVLGFTTATSLFTVLFFGIAPALFTTQLDVNHALKRSGRGATASRGQQRLRQLLIIGQFAMAMTLVAGAGYFVRGASNLLKQHFGWDSAHVVVGSFELPAAKYSGPEQIQLFHRQAVERLQQLPGVTAVSLSYGQPFTGLMGPRSYLVEGRGRPGKGQEPSASYNGIAPEYFEVTGTHRLSGRAFNTTDTVTSPKVVIINESMARALFPGESAIGHRLALAESEKPEWAEIVGVVADVRAVGIYQRPVLFQVYHPFVQEPWGYANLAVRLGNIAPESVFDPIRAAITKLDPDLPVRELMTADTRIARSSNDVSMLKKMLVAFALLGLTLAALGIYGVIARTVVQRTSEIGIRMALGAQVHDVIRLILGSGLRLSLTGTGLGLAGAFGLSRLIASIMPSMQTDGGLVLSAATALLVAVAFAACWLPARRATRVDPLVALRAE